MNTNNLLNKALEDIAKVDALMFAIERSYLDIDVLPEELERANRGVNTFYALWDVVRQLSKELMQMNREMCTLPDDYVAKRLRGK